MKSIPKICLTIGLCALLPQNGYASSEEDLAAFGKTSPKLTLPEEIGISPREDLSGSGEYVDLFSISAPSPHSLDAATGPVANDKPARTSLKRDSGPYESLLKVVDSEEEETSEVVYALKSRRTAELSEEALKIIEISPMLTEEHSAHFFGKFCTLIRSIPEEQIGSAIQFYPCAERTGDPVLDANVGKLRAMISYANSLAADPGSHYLQGIFLGATGYMEDAHRALLFAYDNEVRESAPRDYLRLSCANALARFDYPAEEAFHMAREYLAPDQPYFDFGYDPKVRGWSCLSLPIAARLFFDRDPELHLLSRAYDALDAHIPLKAELGVMLHGKQKALSERFSLVRDVYRRFSGVLKKSPPHKEQFVEVFFKLSPQILEDVLPRQAEELQLMISDVFQ